MLNLNTNRDMGRRKFMRISPVLETLEERKLLATLNFTEPTRFVEEGLWFVPPSDLISEDTDINVSGVIGVPPEVPFNQPNTKDTYLIELNVSKISTFQITIPNLNAYDITVRPSGGYKLQSLSGGTENFREFVFTNGGALSFQLALVNNGPLNPIGYRVEVELKYNPDDIDAGPLPVSTPYTFTAQALGTQTPSPPNQAVNVLINGTADESDDITVFNPSGAQQTIPVRLNGAPGASYSLAVEPASAASLSATSIIIPADGVVDVVLTPLAISSSPNDVNVVATPLGGGSAVRQDMTIVSITIPNHIRATNTPSGMPDRIPPRVVQTFQVEITPDLSDLTKSKGQAVYLRIEDMPGSGTASIVTDDGQSQPGMNIQAFVKSGDLKILGTSQTTASFVFADDRVDSGGLAISDPPPRLSLVARVHGIDAEKSAPFSIRAIPTGIIETFKSIVPTFPNGRPFLGGRFNPLRYREFGFIVRYRYISDSNDSNDLSGIDISEVVKNVKAFGAFRPEALNTSNYLPASKLILTGNDTHTFRSVGPVRFSRPFGGALFSQLFKFRDAVTNSGGFVVRNSGFKIVAQTYIDTYGRFTARVFKVGEKVTINGLSSDPGFGAAVESYQNYNGRPLFSPQRPPERVEV